MANTRNNRRNVPVGPPIDLVSETPPDTNEPDVFEPDVIIPDPVPEPPFAPPVAAKPSAAKATDFPASYPVWRYRTGEAPRVFTSRAQLEAAGPGWKDNPAKV